MMLVSSLKDAVSHQGPRRSPNKAWSSPSPGRGVRVSAGTVVSTHEVTRGSGDREGVGGPVGASRHIRSVSTIGVAFVIGGFAPLIR